MNPKDLAVRTLIHHPYSRKKVWLISEREPWSNRGKTFVLQSIFNVNIIKRSNNFSNFQRFVFIDSPK